MGPQSEGGPSGDGRNYGSQHAEDNRRYEDRDAAARYDGGGMHDQLLPRPNLPFTNDGRMTGSPTGSASGGRDRDRDLEGRRSPGERNRSRPRNGRTASGQLKMCQKCGELLTGQFVRALGGMFHLDCFRCRVSIFKLWSLTKFLG